MPQNAAIHDLSEKAGLWNQFPHHVGNVFLALGREGFLIAGPPAESDYNYFLPLRQSCSPSKPRRQQTAAECYTGGTAQKIAAIARYKVAEFRRTTAVL